MSWMRSASPSAASRGPWRLGLIKLTLRWTSNRRRSNHSSSVTALFRPPVRDGQNAPFVVTRSRRRVGEVDGDERGDAPIDRDAVQYGDRFARAGLVPEVDECAAPPAAGR